MTTRKGIENEAREADSIKPARDVRHGLHLIPSNDSGIKISLPAGESLRELLDSFKLPLEIQCESPDDELPPAA